MFTVIDQHILRVGHTGNVCLAESLAFSFSAHISI